MLDRRSSITLLAFLSCSSLLLASDLEQTLLAIQDALAAGSLSAASSMIETSLKDHPRDGGLVNLRGIVHAQRNELPEARADFEKAVRLAPGLQPAWQNLARACQLEAEQDKSAAPCALSAWQRVLQLKPDISEAHAALARLYQQQAKYSDSLQQVQFLRAPESEMLAIALVKCADLAALGRESEAKTIAASLAAQAEFSESDWQGVSESFSSPASAEVAVVLLENLDSRRAAGAVSLRSLTIVYEHLKRPQDARKVLEGVAMLDPQNTADLLELARLADEEKDYEGALGYLAHARDLTPDNAQIHFLFAMVAMKINLPVEARASLAKALDLEPENPAYNYGMGFAILSTRDAATAGSYFQKFVKAKPGEAKGHYALGIADFASGDYLNSKKEMESVARNPGNAGGAEYFLGRIARLENDLPSAAEHLRRSIGLLPGFAESHTELARVFLLQRKMLEARAELDQAIRLDPESFPANEQMLLLLKRTHDPAADKQSELLRKLDEERSKRAELMLRTVEARP